MSERELVRELADRQAITDLIYRYCRAVDRIDAELGYSVWHADGLADYGEKIFQGTGRGFIDYVCEAHRNLLGHSHQVTTVIIDLDGDRASSEAYYFASMRMQAGEQLKQLYVWGRYLDQWSRRNGRWGIDRRVALIDFDEIGDVTLFSATQLRRDPSDPSYAVLQHYPRRA